MSTKKGKNTSKKGKKNNFMNSTISVGAITAPQALDLINKMPQGEKKRFFDFVTTTTNVNSGTQQYGAGQKLERNVRAIGGPNGGSRRQEVTLIPFRCEKVMEISLPATSGFKVERLQINAGLLSTFPWLNLIAQGFEKYRFRRISARFQPKVGIYSDAAKVGNVLMSVDYDSVDPDPPGPDWMENANPHVVGTASKTLTLKFGADGWRFIRSGNVPAGTDIRLYDVCTLFVATSDFSDTNSVIGKLYLDYEVELAVPQQALAATDDKGVVLPKPMERTFTCSCLRSMSVAGMVAGAYQVLQGFFTTSMNALGVSVHGSVNQFIHVPRGNYIVRINSSYIGITSAVGGLLALYVNGVSQRETYSFPVAGSLQSHDTIWQVSVSDEAELYISYKPLCAVPATGGQTDVIITTC